MTDDAAARRKLMEDLDRQIVKDGGGLLENLQETTRQLRQQDLLARLGNMLADLQGYIDRRAGEVAAPHIAEAGRLAGVEVAAARATQQRAEDLVAELRRRLAALESSCDRYRKRAEIVEGAVVRGLAALATPPDPDPGAHEVTIAIWQRGYQACAEQVKRALNGGPG